MHNYGPYILRAAWQAPAAYKSGGRMVYQFSNSDIRPAAIKRQDRSVLDLRRIPGRRSILLLFEEDEGRRRSIKTGELYSLPWRY